MPLIKSNVNVLGKNRMLMAHEFKPATQIVEQCMAFCLF